MFELLLKVKELNKEASPNSGALDSLLGRVASARQRFVAFNADFRVTIERFKTFCRLLKECLSDRNGQTEDQRAFAMHVFFYLVNEGTPQNFLVAFARDFLGVGLQPFKEVLEADLWKLNSKEDLRKNIDFIFGWLLENQGETGTVTPAISAPILREKFRVSKNLSTLHEYTESCREVEPTILFEAVRDLMDPAAVKAPNHQKREQIQKAIAEFVQKFKPDEVRTPLERVLRRGFYALTTDFCHVAKKVGCPTCDETISRVRSQDYGHQQ